MLLFLMFVTFINYFLLLRMARGIILLYLFIVQGEGVRLDFFFKIFLLLREKGGTSKCFVFFLLSFDMWKEEGKGVSFFFKTFFSLFRV